MDMHKTYKPEEIKEVFTRIRDLINERNKDIVEAYKLKFNMDRGIIYCSYTTKKGGKAYWVYTEDDKGMDSNPFPLKGYFYIARLDDEDEDEVRLIAHCIDYEQAQNFFAVLTMDPYRIFPPADDEIQEIEKLKTIINGDFEDDEW